MESITTRSVTKRRRWPIIAIVLVLVSGVAWWNWPRGDARLVGMWTISPDDKEQHALSFQGRTNLLGGFRFRRNGVLEVYGVGTSIDAKTGKEVQELSSECVYCPWSVAGDQLSFGFRASPVVLSAIEFVDSYVTLPLLVEGNETRIAAVTGDEITLVDEHDMVMKLRRIRE